MSNFHGATGLIGGAAGALDAIDGAGLSDGDAAFVVVEGTVYHYFLDADSAAAENSPAVISPDDNPGDKRWILVGLRAVGAAVFHDASQNAANAAWTTLAFNSERWDTDSIHDNSTNNSRLTCKTAGKYVIVGNFTFPANATGERGVRIFLNNTTIISMAQSLASTVDARMNIPTIYDLSVDDYIELEGYQDSGGVLAIPSTAEYSPEFRMQRIA